MSDPIPSLSRRQFVGAVVLGAAATLVPRSVLGGPKFVAPNERINVGYIGCGTQGLRLLMEALAKPELRFVAVCDPNRKSDDYPEWSKGELNGKIRKFLNDPNWAKGARGGLCGREVGQEIVNRYYGKQKRLGESGDCRAYADYRELLEQEKDLDAVYIMTPDHHHGAIAVRAMRMGKHVIGHKPIANVLAETRLARDTAREAGVATHMHCSAAKPTTPMLCEWIAAGFHLANALGQRFEFSGHGRVGGERVIHGSGSFGGGIYFENLGGREGTPGTAFILHPISRIREMHPFLRLSGIALYLRIISNIFWISARSSGIGPELAVVG